MERWLTDSCASLKNAMVADNKESEHSKSKNKLALAFYTQGVKELSKDNYQAALSLFEKSVEQDAEFSFAWDNIGICKRKLDDLDGALSAYLKSLELDPKGKVPLQNIPVVYQYKKEYDKALEAYKNFSKVFPDDPESYYGAGKIYESKEDYEKALDNMCKAYSAYVAANFPYRVDAENNISLYYKKMKEMGKEELFYKILKDNHLNAK
jgi:tetratricopeptide (TPR) repeat protein